MPPGRKKAVQDPGPRYSFYIDRPTHERYSEKFVPKAAKGEKARGVRGGVLYVLRKFPALYHATIDEASRVLGDSRWARLTDRLATQEKDRLKTVPSRELMMFRLDGGFAVRAAAELGFGAVVEGLPAFARVSLEIGALMLLADQDQLEIPRQERGSRQLLEMQAFRKDFDLVFYARGFGKTNLSAALGLITRHFWAWHDAEMREVGRESQADRLLPVLKAAMGDSVLPEGNFTGEALRHRLTVQAARAATASERALCDEALAWYAAGTAFRRAALELFACTHLTLGHLKLVSTKVLPSTVDFFETHFGSAAAGAGFACETMRALLEAQLATGFIRATFEERELLLLGELLREGGLPKGEEIGLHLLNLIDSQVGRLQMGGEDDAQPGGTIEDYEELLRKILPLSLLERIMLILDLQAKARQ